MAATTLPTAHTSKPTNRASGPEVPKFVSDRRSEPRFPYQTVVTLVRVLGTNELDLKKCWTRDLSPSGARIMSLEPINGERVLLKFLLPKLGSQFIEADICSRAEEQQFNMQNRQTTMHLYGVRFVNVLTDAAVCERVL